MQAIRTIQLLKSQTQASAEFLSDERNHELLPQPQPPQPIQNNSSPFNSTPLSSSSYYYPGLQDLSPKQQTSPVSSDHLTSSLASARGKKPSSHSPSHSPKIGTSTGRRISTISEESTSLNSKEEIRKRSSLTKKSSSSSQASKVTPDNDPFYKFYSTITTVVSKTHSQTRDVAKITSKFSKNKPVSSNNYKNGNVQNIVSSLKSKNKLPTSSRTTQSALSSSNMTSSISSGPTDSYYVVSSKPSASKYSQLQGNDLAAENEQLREQLNEVSLALEAYYDTFERQKEVIKSSLAQLRAEVLSQDKRRITELEEQNESLKAENDHLKSQLMKLKIRK